MTIQIITAYILKNIICFICDFMYVIIMKYCVPTIRNVMHANICQPLGPNEKPLLAFVFNCYPYHYLSGILKVFFLDSIYDIFSY